MKIKNIKVYTNGAWVVHELPFEEYLTKAKSYADTQDDSTLSSAKSYTDTKATETLNSAKSYTDQEVNASVKKTGDEMSGSLILLGPNGGDYNTSTENRLAVYDDSNNYFRSEVYSDRIVVANADYNNSITLQFVTDETDFEYSGAYGNKTLCLPQKDGTLATLDDLSSAGLSESEVQELINSNNLEKNIDKMNNTFDFDGQTSKARVLELKEYVNDTTGQGVQVHASGTIVKNKNGENYGLTLPDKNGTIATTDDIADGVLEAKTYADTKSNAALSSAKSYTDTEIAKISASGGSFSGTMSDQRTTGSTTDDYTYTSIVKMDPNASVMPTDSGLKVTYSEKRNGASNGSNIENATTYSSDGVVLKHDHDNYSYGKDYYDMTLNASSLEFEKRIKTFNNSQAYAFDSKYEVSKLQLSAPIPGKNAASSKDDLSTVKFALPTDSEMKDGKMPYFETISPAGVMVNGNRDMQSYKLELPRSTGTLAIYPTTSYAKGDYDSPAVVNIDSQTPVSIYFKIGPENTYTGAKGHNYSRFMGFHMPDIGIFVTYEELLHAYSCYKNYTKFLSIGGASSVNNGDSGILIQTIKNDALYLIQVHYIDKIFDEDNNQRFEIAFHCMQVGSRQGHIVGYNIGRVYAVQETLTEKITNSFNPGSGY